MVIVTDFGCLVHEYVECFCQLVFPRPECLSPLSRARCHDRARVLPAQGAGARRRCMCCASSVGTARRVTGPSRCCPASCCAFRHYLLDVIQSVVVTRFEDEASWAQVARRCAVEGAPSPRTIRRWCDSLAEHASAWWAAVQQTLAEHDAASPLLDPLGEAAGPRDAPRALLQAALHLLAWAKTRWAELADYGLADRLRFLWHWGAGRGLGRLL